MAGVRAVPGSERKRFGISSASGAAEEDSDAPPSERDGVAGGDSRGACRGARGNCWDNACSETLFGSLKVERLHGMQFKNHREAKDATLDWLLWYNGSRMHSTLRYLSPTQFEQQASAQRLALAA